jgi:hypothetical protein
MAITKISRAQRSIKHDIISKDSTRIVAAVAVSVFIIVFCGFAIKTLFSQSLYHNRVISEKEKTKKQLEDNKKALEELKQSYDAFVNNSENILGGSPSGTGSIDGNNAKIVLDALPGQYDYPALSTSFEKILVDGGYKVDTLGGSEDTSIKAAPTGKAEPITVAYGFTITAPFAQTFTLLQTLERSIRPMNVDRLGIQVEADGGIRTQVTLHTYFTQQKAYELGSKEVK